MQNHKDNYAGSDENALFRLSMLSVLGDREEQQDSLGCDLKLDEGLVVICDGMGGHEGGKIASTVAVDQLLKIYSSDYPCQNIHQMLAEAARQIDSRISSLTHPDGIKMQSGSTIIAVHIRKDELHWLSVGDSRIYLFRNGELVRATQDHVYRRLLDEQLDSGKITKKIYDAEMSRGEALVSFLGINGLPQIDSNETPLTLHRDDLILLMTDGLYKLLSDEEIGRILGNFVNIDDALKALEAKAQKTAKKTKACRDNMTLALLKIK